ncbi:MAG: diguanylate cyclase [Oscillospiraceae bacterium]|nr:diguanylate cyclase [Oscillospiraceae bacterium]
MKKTLRFLLSVFVVIPAILLLVFVFNILSNFSRQTLETEVGEVGAFKAAAIVNVFERYKSEISAAASLDFIKKTGAGLYNAQIKEETDSYINKTILNNPYILDIAITDATSGGIITDYIGRELVGIFPGSQLDREISEALSISEIKREDAEHERQSTFYITKPLYNDDVLTGYIHFTVSTAVFSQQLFDSVFLDKATLLILDGNGSVLGIENTLATEYSKINDSKVVDFISNLDPAVKNTANPYEKLEESARHIGAYGFLSGMDWCWLVIYPVSGLGALYQGYFLTFALVLFGIVLLCFVAVFFISKAAVSPLKGIISATKDMNDGAKPKSLPEENARGEFGRIARVLNTLNLEATINENLSSAVSQMSESVSFTDEHFVEQFMSAEDVGKYNHALERLLNSGVELAEEYLLKGDDGARRWCSVKARRVDDSNGELKGIIGFITDIDREKRLSIQLSQCAGYDYLTEFYDHSTFMKELKLKLKNDTNIAVLFVAIDDFRQLNSQHGHIVGDELLKYLCTVLKTELKDDGFVGRFSGDEFAVCITSPKLTECVKPFATRLIGIYDKGFYSKTADTTLNFKVNIGIAMSERGKTADELIATADAAMYHIKKRGEEMTEGI